MSLQSQLSNLVVRIATEFKVVKSLIGDKSSLSTTNKTNIVAAINELQSSINAATQILDSATTGDTSHTWSANKITSELTALKSSIVSGAPAAYDTLLEISNALSDENNSIAAILTALSNRVAFDQSQSLTSGQMAQAIANIGAISASDVGDVTTNFVTAFETALV